MALLLSAFLVTGCMSGGGGQQQAPGPKEEDIQKAVKQTLHEDAMKDFMRTQVKNEAGVAMLEMALDTQEGQKALQESVKQAITSPMGEQLISKKVGEMINDPLIKSQMQQALRDAMMEVLAKGTEEKQKKDEKKGGGGKEGGGGGG